MLRKIAWALIIMAIVIFNAFRFWKLDAAPNGYHINELASAVTLQCLSEQGCDANLRPWPLFGAINYGQDKPPTYIYPGIIWVKIFGSTVPSLRAYSAFVLLLGILGLFLLARQRGGVSLGLTVALAATASPWAWVISRVAIESFFAPVLTIWGLYFFWRSTRVWDWAMAGLFFAAAMYAYPPARLQVPLMLASLLIFEWKERPMSWKPALSLGLVFAAALLPLLAGYAQGHFSRRFNQIGLLNRDYWFVLGKSGSAWDIFTTFIHNYVLHLTPAFLFLTGDHSYVYSTRHSGIMGWLDMAALILLPVLLAHKKPLLRHRRWLWFLLFNFMIGIIPSALTNQELPHALRICGSWPFLMLFTGLIWQTAAELWAAAWIGLGMAGILGGAVLMWQYFSFYPQESKEMFGFRAKLIAGELKTPDDWNEFARVFRPQPYHCRYFVAHGLGKTCREARDICAP